MCGLFRADRFEINRARAAVPNDRILTPFTIEYPPQSY
jgi:hypothetical protein